MFKRVQMHLMRTAHHTEQRIPHCRTQVTGESDVCKRGHRAREEKAMTLGSWLASWQPALLVPTPVRWDWTSSINKNQDLQGCSPNIIASQKISPLQCLSTFQLGTKLAGYETLGSSQIQFVSNGSQICQASLFLTLNLVFFSPG